MVRIQDVAKRAGVSSASVSRVLARKPHVSEEVKQRVWEAVEALNYRPNRMARSLREQRSRIIALIISDIENPFFTRLARAVQDLTAEAGYSVFMCNTDEDPEKEAHYLELMHDENVAGIIISPTREQNTQLQQILDNKVPVVVIDRRIIDIEVDTVTTDNMQAAYKLTKHLIDKGHRRIAAIVGSHEITTGRERMEGYQSALSQSGIDIDPDLMFYVEPREIEGYNATRHLLEMVDYPDAILAGNNSIALGILRALHESSETIAKNIEFVGFMEDIHALSVFKPNIAVIKQPTYEIGKIATELLLDRIKQPTRPIRDVKLKGELISDFSNFKKVKD